MLFNEENVYVLKYGIYCVMGIININIKIDRIFYWEV